MMHSIDEDAVIRNVNSKWLKEMGYEREEVIGRKVDFLMTPESQQRLWAVLARFWREGKISDLFYQYVRKNGTVMDVLLDSVVVNDPVWGKVSLTVVRDITAQRRAENALRESEERYRTLIETMNEGFGIQDVRGIITYANHKLCEMLQCSQEELIGRSANDFFDAFDQTVDHLPKMLNDTSYEVTWTGKNGGRVATIMSPRPLFDFQGEFIGSCAVITDISERKRKEEEVARLRHQLELILSSAWEGIFGLDAEGNHTFVNPAAARLLGYEVRELIGKKTHAIWHHFKLDGSPYPEEECPIFTALNTGIAYHSTDEILWKKDGSSLTAEFAVSPIKDGSQVIGAVATFWDTTRRRRDEQVIRAARETLEAIFNAITESLILLDRDGHVISMNKTAAERLGETEEQLTGRSIYDLLAPGTENRRAEYESVIQSRRPSRFEDVLGEMILDQHVYPVFGPDSTVERLVVFARDITEQKLTENQLRQSEERFRTIFESARDCIYIRDRSLKYTHVNPAMEKIFGLQASELIGRTPRDLFTPEQAASTERADKRVLKGEVVQREHVLTIRGTNFRIDTILLPMHNAAGDIIGVCGISRDISDLQRVEFPPPETIEKYPSRAMKSILSNANLAAKRDTTVLLLGESGSGKDHLARYIHNRSSRADGPFFAINCAAITPSLAESELFGHERGAFTGAVGRKRGLLELADAGTLLLNEIGELSLALQSKLLSFLDTRKFTRVGGEREIRVNSRLIAATNKDLEKEVENGTFRKDLLYRLNVMSIMVPPLRERIEDIPLLVQEILSKIRVELQLPEIPIIGVSTMNALKQYSWPGNVRELRNVLERASILSPGREISLPPVGLLSAEDAALEDWSFKICFPSDKAVTEILDDLRNALAGEALRRSNGNRKNAARLLGISRDTFYRYMKSGVKD